MNVPDHLSSTYRMLRTAYPDGLPDSDFLAVVVLLYDQMSDRNLAEVISLSYSKDYFVTLNDIAKAVTTHRPTLSAVDRAKSRLESAGYGAWLQEEA